MEKYRSFTAITNEFLDGSLVELDMKYAKSDKINIVVIYKFNDFMNLCYELEVDLTEKKVEFLSHGSNGAYDKVRLGRDMKFETAVQKILFA